MLWLPLLIIFWLFSPAVVCPAEPPGEAGEAISPKGEEKAVVPAHIGAAEVCPCTFGPLIADTAIPIEEGKFAIQPLWALGFTGGSFTQNWRRVSAGGDFISFETPWKFTYGLAKNLEVFLVIPYVHNWARNVSEAGPGGERSAGFGGIGDINLTFKYIFLEETDKRPAVTGLFAVDFPSGHHCPLNPGRLGTDEVGSGAYTFTVGCNLSQWLPPFILYGNLWYSMSTTTRSTVEHEIFGPVLAHFHARDALTFNLAAEYPFRGLGPWVGLLEFYSIWEMGPLFGPRSDSPGAALIGILPGIEYIYSEKLAFALGVGIDLAGKNADYNYTPIFSMVYTF
jgi:hypothetical protein